MNTLLRQTEDSERRSLFFLALLGILHPRNFFLDSPKLRGITLRWLKNNLM